MTRELFLDDSGIASSTGLAIVPVAGTHSDPVLTVDAGAASNRVYFGSMFHDVNGDIGTAGRIHYWHRVAHVTGQYVGAESVWQTYSAYAYSDDKGETPFVRPVVGRVTYGGNTNNNLTSTAPIVGVAVRVGDAKPFKYVKPSGTPGYMGIYESADPYLVTGETLLRTFYYEDSTLMAGTSDGLCFITGHEQTKSYASHLGVNIIASRSGVFNIFNDIASDPDRIEWNTIDPYQTKDATASGQNVIRPDGSPISSPGDEHAPSFIGDVTDLWGRIALMSVHSHFYQKGRYGYWESALVTARGFEDGIVPHSSIYRVGSSDSEMLLKRGAQQSFPVPTNSSSYDATGVWDGGCVHIEAGSWLSTADAEIAFYGGWNIDYGSLVYNANCLTPTHDIWQLGRATWRKDGLTKLTGTGSYTTPLISKASKHIRVNYNGTLSCEMRDAGGNVIISGYSAAECDLATADTLSQRVTWGSGARDGSEVTSASLAWTLSGDLYAYELADPLLTATPTPTSINLAYSGTAPFKIERRVV